MIRTPLLQEEILFKATFLQQKLIINENEEF